jgi:hypothetical protein
MAYQIKFNAELYDTELIVEPLMDAPPHRFGATQIFMSNHDAANHVQSGT